MFRENYFLFLKTSRFREMMRTKASSNFKVELYKLIRDTDPEQDQSKTDKIKVINQIIGYDHFKEKPIEEIKG